MKIDRLISNNNIFDSINYMDKSEEKKDISFFDILKEELNEVNEKQVKAEDLTESFIKGDNVDIHEVMLGTEEAKMSLELAVQIRNKIVEAYQEISRMQL